MRYTPIAAVPPTYLATPLAHMQAVSVALLAQNLLDDFATVFERFYALVHWGDPFATLLAAVALSVGAVLLYLLGLRLIIAGVGMYYFR